MREILFRGKRTDNGEWIYGNYRKMPDSTGINHIIDVPAKDPDDANKTFFVNSESVHQYTGLKNFNGKKIFEGDICEFTIPCFDGGDEHYIGVVVFIDGCYMICKSPKGEEFENNEMFYLVCAIENDDEFIVTGNIVDRPDFTGGRVF